ncbi:MAG: hypothetical protein PHV43_02915 [Candidatus Colwellbacteria bacterium]|nr:hypothetical protein [Candidatus Colwellbacteria bacterium]
MKRNNFFALTGLIFSAIFVIHGLRIINGWQFSLGSWEAPIVASWVCLLISGWLAWTAYSFLRNK